MTTSVIVNGYCSRLDIKGRLGEIGTADDTRIDAIITAISRWIDSECHRFFFSYTGTRYYTPRRSTYIDVDDFTNLTTLQTDLDGDGTFETTWTPTDYVITPFNARVESPAQPYNGLQRALFGAFVFPITIPRSVAVTAAWGFDTTVPVVISEACILQATRIFRRGDAPFGVVGAGEMGQATVIGRLDPDVRMMLSPYRKVTVA